MTLHPAVQHKAQAEVDRVVKDRLPAVTDQDNLPYIKAVALEVLRWAVHTTTGRQIDDPDDRWFIPIV